ncbi:MAG TPA: hypothetical protein VEW03_04865, partial [Longimicrobiaceae bacterium]|nr:hypothetical protein [Longimicrobiaceae bacterium]
VQHPGGVTFTSIAAGDKHTCALDGSSGQAYCWGYGGDGAVGNNSLLGSKVPVAVSQGGVTFTAVTTEYNHSCGLTSGGQAYCWGYNFYGQLGDNSTTNRKTPVAVSQGGVTFVQVATGAAHTCGLTSGGQDYCWGQNTYGQLGTGNTTQSLTPVAVSQGGVTYVSAHTGGHQSFGLDSGGQTYGWGRNNFGQVGDGTSTNRTSPVAVSH